MRLFHILCRLKSIVLRIVKDYEMRLDSVGLTVKFPAALKYPQSVTLCKQAREPCLINNNYDIYNLKKLSASSLVIL